MSIFTDTDGNTIDLVDYEPFIEVDGSWFGSDILTWSPDGGHHMSKLVALGYDCDELH